jgi:polyphosphate kinase
VETLFPILKLPLVRRIRDKILNVYLNDNVKARVTQSDGSYVRVTRAKGDRMLDAQAALLKSR